MSIRNEQVTKPALKAWPHMDCVALWLNARAEGAGEPGRTADLPTALPLVHAELSSRRRPSDNPGGNNEATNVCGADAG
jgi:hypothetical protein